MSGFRYFCQRPWRYYTGVAYGATVPPTDVQRAVLRLLAENRLQLTPNNIARNTGYSAGYVRKQCVELSEAGYLARDDGTNPFYGITPEGRAYLDGE